jgi:hypothetical protein
MINKYSFLFLILFVSHGAFGWNDFGHMAVAAIAYPQLSAPARQQVAELLKRNPNYAEWIRGIDKSEQERTACMRAAIWPDAIRHILDYYEEPEHNTTGISPNNGYRDKRIHRAWHYRNAPISPDQTPSHPASVPNIETQIAVLESAPQSRQADIDTKSYSLVWLLHLVGDTHQPLHAASRYTRDFPQGDRGGNGIIICEQTCDPNLHSLWDGVLGKLRQPQTILRMVASYPHADKQRAQILDANIWLQESVAIAQRGAYAQPVGISADSSTLSGSYKANARFVAQQQVALAGTRLANLLNRLFR